MNFEETLKVLQQLLPSPADPVLLEELALQSSYLVFDQPGETLFRTGDAPKGFYWVLTGEVQQIVCEMITVTVGAGAMVGLEEFIEQRTHHSHWVSRERTEALFVDRRCFEKLATSPTGLNLTLSQLSRQLLQLKGNCRGQLPPMSQPA